MKFTKEYKNFNIKLNTKNISIEKSIITNYKSIITNYNELREKFKIDTVENLDIVFYKINLSPINVWLWANNEKRDILYFEFIKYYNVDIDNLTDEKNYILFSNLPRNNKLFNNNAYDIETIILSRIDQDIRAFMEGFNKRPKKVKNFLIELDEEYKNSLEKIDKTKDENEINYLNRVK